MRFLTRLSCSDSNVDAAGYGVIELSPESAQKVITLHERVREFLRLAAEDELLCEFMTPSFGFLGCPFSAYRYTEQLSELLRDATEVVALADETALDLDDEKTEERVECYRIRVGEDSVQFTALAKHGDFSLTTGDISLEELRKVAAAVTA